MEHFYFLIALGVIVVLLVLLSFVNTLKRHMRLPYVVDEALFSRPQRAFKGVLERAVGKDYQIYGKVRAVDVIGLKPQLSRREQDRALERLGERCFDFLVCARQTDAIVCAVNLAPRSRLRKLPPKDGLDRICAAARLPFVRFYERKVYSVVEIKEQIVAALQGRDRTASVDELVQEDASAALNERSAAIDEKRRPASQRVLSAPGQTLPDERAVRAQPMRRRDPIIQNHHVVDDGPTFKIAQDLDDHSLESRSR